MHASWKVYAPLLVGILLALWTKDGFANPKDSGAIPWDTVMANIQVIESMNEPDSVKNTLTQQLFSEHHLTAEDYRRFYNDFLKRSPEEQAAFLKSVEGIILEWMNRDHKKAR